MAAAAAGAFVALSGSSPAEAHHSVGMFDLSTPIWVKGTVIAYEPIAPNAMIHLEETTANA
jgi:hypothetical protein